MVIHDLRFLLRHRLECALDKFRFLGTARREAPSQESRFRNVL